jgi:hypothetical protein
METDATIGDDGTGWEGPVKGNKRLPDPNKDFPPLKIRNTFEPLNRVIIHGFVENFHDLKQMLHRNVGKNFNVKFTGRNTTIYTQNKRDWNKVKGILSQNETSYHSFTHKEEKTHAFVLRGLCQNPAPEEVKAALEEEHNLVKRYIKCAQNAPHS